MLGKLEEARLIVAANWRLNAPPHANTTPRIAFLRHFIALCSNRNRTGISSWEHTRPACEFGRRALTLVIHSEF